jgi:hypothetical protein
MSYVIKVSFELIWSYQRQNDEEHGIGDVIGLNNWYFVWVFLVFISTDNLIKTPFFIRENFVKAVLV